MGIAENLQRSRGRGQKFLLHSPHFYNLGNASAGGHALETRLIAISGNSLSLLQSHSKGM